MSRKQLDDGLRRYYKHFNTEYDSNEIGKIMGWCDENGYDTDMIKDELLNDAKDCEIVDFDESFPTNKSGNERMKEIFQIILHCWEYPEAFNDYKIIANKKPVKKEKKLKIIYSPYKMKRTESFLKKFGWTYGQIFNAFNKVYDHKLTKDFANKCFKCTQEQLDEIVKYLICNHPKPKIFEDQTKKSKIHYTKVNYAPPNISYEQILSTPVILMNTTNILSLFYGYFRSMNNAFCIYDDIILLCNDFCFEKKQNVVENIENININDSKEHIVQCLFLNKSSIITDNLNIKIFDNVEICSHQWIESENDITLCIGGDLIMRNATGIKSNCGNIILNVEGNILMEENSNIIAEALNSHVYIKCNNFTDLGHATIKTAPTDAWFHNNIKETTFPRTLFGNIYMKIKNTAIFTDIEIISGDINIEIDDILYYKYNTRSFRTAFEAYRNKIKIKVNELRIQEDKFIKIGKISYRCHLQLIFNKLKIKKYHGISREYVFVNDQKLINS